jgi:hypothetical protein
LIVAPLDNGVNDKYFRRDYDIIFDTIALIVSFYVIDNVFSVSDLHNRKGEGRDPQIPALGYQKVLLLEECFQFFDLNLLCFNSLNEDRSKS